MSTVAIDARMIRHSGIGVALQGFLGHWALQKPPFDLILCGNPELLKKDLPARLEARIIPWNPGVYTPGAAFSRPALPRDVAAWYSPHYATTLRPGVPLVAHVQDILHLTHPSRPGVSLYARAYFEALRRRGRFVLTTTRFVKVQLQTLLHFPAHRVLCTGLGPGIFNDGDGTKTVPLPAQLQGRRFMLAVGIDKPHKNWRFLLERISRIETPLPLLACAGLGEGHRAIRRVAHELGISGKIIILDNLSRMELRAVYTNATALVFPSLSEGFGLPVVEAMAAGTPVLIADRSPMTEIADNAALRFDPDYPESFDAQLGRLLGDEPLRETLRERGHAVAARYAWADSTKRVEEALMRAITGRLQPATNGKT